MSIPREGMSQAAQTYISPGTEPVENKSVLPKGRELKWWKKAVPWTIEHENPDVPAPKTGTLQQDNGSGKVPPDEPKVIRGG